MTYPGGSSQTAPATARLLWAACRPVPDVEGCERAVAGGADLSWASRVAVAQRVSPLLWRVAQRWASSEDLWSEALRDDYRRCKAQALMVRPLLRSLVLEPLASAGVQPMLIKGAAIAERYGEPGMRPMDDLDVLAQPDQHRKAIAVLRKAGWRTTPRQGPSYSLSLAHPQMPGLPVDLHHDLAVAEDQVFRFTAADLWKSGRSGSLFGSPALVPSPEMELLLIATHAGKPYHNFDRLLWAVDAAVIVSAADSTGSPIDWGWVQEASRRAFARSALAVLLAQAERLGAESPAPLREVQAGATRRWALEIPRSEIWPLERRDERKRIRLTYAVIDDPWLRVRRFSYHMTKDGLVRAPFRGALLTWRVLRRVWRLRTTSRVSADEGDEQVNPIVTNREP